VCEREAKTLLPSPTPSPSLGDGDGDRLALAATRDALAVSRAARTQAEV
jgi:hypothetical protein